MKNKFYRILAYILAVLPAIILGVLYNKLPSQVPTHWNLDGTVTYSGKVSLWGMVLLGIMLAILFDVIPHIDPKKKNYKKFGKYYDAFCLFMMVFLLIMTGIILFESFSPGKLPVQKVVVVLISILFMFLGNILPKIKNNFSFGIKTPWTLSDADVWNKTQRLGGRLMFALGLITLVLTFILTSKILFIVFFIGLIVVTLIPTVMSYIWYKNLSANEE